MNKLLNRYCDLFKINTLDFKGGSRENGLPTYRHIFYYCVKSSFDNVKLRHIAKVADKKPSGVSYGIGIINNLITPITKAGSAKNIVTSEMQIIKDYVISFLSICKEYKGSDLELPE